MGHHYNTRLNEERGMQSPLSTRYLRDRLARRPLKELVLSSDSEEDTMDDHFSENEEQSPEELESSSRRRRRSSKVSSSEQSPPIRKVMVSSPVEGSADAELISPQFSRIEANVTPGSVKDENQTRPRSRKSKTKSPSIDESQKTRSFSSEKGSTQFRVSLSQEFISETPLRRDTLVKRRSISRVSFVKAKSSDFFSTLYKFFVVVAAMFVAVCMVCYYLRPEVMHNLLFVNYEEVAKAPNLEAFKKEFRLVREQYPSQEKRSWAVIGSSLKSVFTRNLTMPACVLLIADSEEAKTTANCLSMRLATTFHNAMGGGIAFNSATLADLEQAEAKRILFDAANKNLLKNHSLAILNVDDMRGNVAMTLHAFCDEYSDAASFPLSTLIMTAQGALLDDASNPDAQADALLTSAWSPDLGIDRVSSLISRVAVSVAVIKKEPELPKICQEEYNTIILTQSSN